MCADASCCSVLDHLVSSVRDACMLLELEGSTLMAACVKHLSKAKAMRAARVELLVPVGKVATDLVEVCVCCVWIAMDGMHEYCGTAVCLSFGSIEKYLMFFVTSACARRTGAAARVERRRCER